MPLGPPAVVKNHLEAGVVAADLRLSHQGAVALVPQLAEVMVFGSVLVPQVVAVWEVAVAAQPGVGLVAVVVPQVNSAAC